MVKDFTKDRVLANRAFPFLANFPFNEDFEICMESAPMLAVTFDEEFDSAIRRPVKTINFKSKNSPLKATISMTYEELSWLSNISDGIKKLDKISKRIDRGLKSKDILTKRDISREADLWLTQVSDNASSLSQETFNEVLRSLIGNKSIKQTVKFITDLNKLYTGKGLIRLTKSDLDIMFTYLHFRLIYAKLILGIIIASKISI